MSIGCRGRTGPPSSAIVCGLLLGLVFAVGLLSGQPAKTEEGLRNPFQNEKWLLEQTLGKLTMDEVVKKLGPPDRFSLDREGVADDPSTWLIWEDVSRVVVDFSLDDDKAHALNATFSPHIKAKQLTPENFRKLKPGMSENEIDKVIGGSKTIGIVTVEYVAPKGTKNAKLRRVEWTVSRRLSLRFDKDGKLVGLLGNGGSLRE
jgi:hypothetical protein